MDVAQQVKAQLDIVRVISDYVPRMRRFGNRYSCLCPFHNEKTASFSIYADHQFYKCFGCDAKGDVFNFVMAIEGLTFWEALKKLAEQNGIVLPKQSTVTDEKTKVRAVVRDMHEIAVDHFRANLSGPAGAPVRAYLEKRGVTPQSVQLFQIGLSEGSGRALQKVLEKRGFRPEQMVESGLVGRRDDGSLYDRFRNRLMFPIHDESGKAIAFGGRALDPEEKAKYLNSPETEIYKKSNVLYNLNRAKQPAAKADRMVLVEGYIDVIAATQAGVTDVVAPCGTSLTIEQIRAIKRHSQNVHLSLDGDAAGKNAAERSIQRLLLGENMRVAVIELDGLDPAEFCQKYGAEPYRDRVAEAKYFFHWVRDNARSRFDPRDPQSRNDMFQFLMPFIQLVPSTLERLSVVNDLASHLGVDPTLVLEHFRKMAADRADRKEVRKLDPTKATDHILLPLLVKHEQARKELVDRLRGVSIDSAAAPIFAALIAMHDAQEAISFNSLHERLSPADQERFSAIVLETDSSALTVEDGAYCIEALRRVDKEAIRRDLKAKIRIAEREGRMQEAIHLMGRLSEII